MRARISRRQALKTLGVAPLALGTTVSSFGSSGCGADELDPGITLGPWPAMPTASSMAIWCEAGRAPHPASLRLESGTLVAEASFEPIAPGLHRARFEGLAQDTRHFFELTDARGVLHGGSFLTMPSATGLARLAISSDIHPSSKPYRAFAQVEALQPHLYLGLGDQVYADLDPEVGLVEPTRRAYEALYRRTWDDPALRSCWADVPRLLVWDDHETINDFDGTGDPRRIAAARLVYERLQHSRSGSDQAWTILGAGPASIFVMDTRSFRSPLGTPDGPDKTMLGAAQLEALRTWLATSPAALRVLASPTPMHRYADTGLDCWSVGYAYERDLVLAAIASERPESVVVVSGDQHWPAVVELPLPGGGSVLELGCTPIAAFSRAAPAASTLGPDALYVGSNVRGFGSLEIDSSGFSFAFVDELGAERFALSRAL